MATVCGNIVCLHGESIDVIALFLGLERGSCVEIGKGPDSLLAKVNKTACRCDGTDHESVLVARDGKFFFV